MKEESAAGATIWERALGIMRTACGGIEIWGVDLELVTQLRQTEKVRLDPDRLDDLFIQLGQHAAEDVVCRALEEMAARLSHIDKSYRMGDVETMAKNARGLGAIAEQLGMPLLAKVARDVTRCVETGDGIAIAATLARLIRIGEKSLVEIWDVQGI